MAVSKTTLSGAVAVTDTEVTLAAITGLAVSNNLVIDGETMRVLSVPAAATSPVGVFRGTKGSNVQTHVAGANVLYGVPSDFVSPARSYFPRREVVSYTVAGVIANPTPGVDRVAVLNGTTLAVMTMGNPAKENEGDMLIVVSNGKAAHTLTYTTTGIGGGGTATDLMTFSVVAQMSVLFIAVNELWVLVGGSSGAGSIAASTVIT
jgi:hypothetical protein